MGRRHRARTGPPCPKRRLTFRLRLCGGRNSRATQGCFEGALGRGCLPTVTREKLQEDPEFARRTARLARETRCRSEGTEIAALVWMTRTASDVLIDTI